MIVIRTYRHGSNSLYVREQLNSEGIISFIEETKSNDLKFNILIKEEDQTRSEEIIRQLDIDDNDVSSESEGYLAGHNEWVDHMYDPGHYTGGKIPHFLLDKSNLKIYGPFFLIIGLTMVYLFAKKWN